MYRWTIAPKLFNIYYILALERERFTSFEEVLMLAWIWSLWFREKPPTLNKNKANLLKELNVYCLTIDCFFQDIEWKITENRVIMLPISSKIYKCIFARSIILYLPNTCKQNISSSLLGNVTAISISWTNADKLKHVFDTLILFWRHCKNIYMFVINCF